MPRLEGVFNGGGLESERMKKISEILNEALKAQVVERGSRTKRTHVCALKSLSH